MIVKISSKNNDNVKYIKKLVASSKFRKENKLFVIEGINLCEEAFKNSVRVTKIFYTLKCYEKFRTLIDKIVLKNNSQAYIVDDEVMNYMSDTDTPQGVIALCAFIDKKVNSAKINLYSKVILLENIQNPYNLGSILRSVSAFGIDLVVIESSSCDIYNPKVLRGSMGAVFRVNILFVDNLVAFLTYLKKQDFITFAAVPDKNSEDIEVLGNYKKTAVVMGNEGNGISFEVIKTCEKKITIPMKESCESLNVSVAAGIITWEMIRKERKNCG